MSSVVKGSKASSANASRAMGKASVPASTSVSLAYYSSKNEVYMSSYEGMKSLIDVAKRIDPKSNPGGVALLNTLVLGGSAIVAGVALSPALAATLGVATVGAAYAAAIAWATTTGLLYSGAAVASLLLTDKLVALGLKMNAANLTPQEKLAIAQNLKSIQAAKAKIDVMVAADYDKLTGRLPGIGSVIAVATPIIQQSNELAKTYLDPVFIALDAKVDNSAYDLEPEVVDELRLGQDIQLREAFGEIDHETAIKLLGAQALAKEVARTGDVDAEAPLASAACGGAPQGVSPPEANPRAPTPPEGQQGGRRKSRRSKKSRSKSRKLLRRNRSNMY